MVSRFANTLETELSSDTPKNGFLILFGWLPVFDVVNHVPRQLFPCRSENALGIIAPWGQS